MKPTLILALGVAAQLSACSDAQVPGAPEEDLVAAPTDLTQEAADLGAGALDLRGGAADLGGARDLAGGADLAGCPSGGTLQPGGSFTVPIDRFTGDEATTQPKGDANDGLNGDSPYFQRTNVARGHLDYWFTSSHREAGEPNPAGDQWVDYRPPLRQLGAGRYRITAQYRQTDNRAPYAALYLVNHRGGVTTVARDQRQGTSYVDLALGEYDLGCAGWVRVKDSGSASRV